MFRTLAIAAIALGAIAATAPAFAAEGCGPGFYFSRSWGECRPQGGYRHGYYETVPPGTAVGNTVAGAGYVAGSAVNAAGNVAGAAVGTAGAIVGCALGGCR
jgi:hypothetical protein